MQLVLDTHNIALRQRNRSFYITAGKERRMISPQKISSIAVVSPCTLTSAAVLLAVEHKIPIIFFDHSGEPEGQVWSTKFGNLAELRRAQVLFAMTDEAIAWAVEVYALKTEGQLDNLRWMKNRAANLPQISTRLHKAIEAIIPLASQLTEKARTTEPFVTLMGTEGSIARHYWPAWGASAPVGFEFSTRSRRPARDYSNAALNYLYGILYNTVESAVLGAGLDPMFGIMHADEFGAPTLVFDLIEPFRPMADRLLMEILFEGTLDTSHFEPYQGGIGVNREGRKVLITCYNNWLQQPVTFMGQDTRLKNHLHKYAGTLANRLKFFWENDHLGKLRHRKRPLASEDSQ